VGSCAKGVTTRKTKWQPAMAGSKVSASYMSASNSRSRSAAPGSARSSPVFFSSAVRQQRPVQPCLISSLDDLKSVTEYTFVHAPRLRRVAWTTQPLPRSFLTSQLAR
jgi:hypothetical protein